MKKKREKKKKMVDEDDEEEDQPELPAEELNKELKNSLQGLITEVA